MKNKKFLIVAGLILLALVVIVAAALLSRGEGIATANAKLTLEMNGESRSFDMAELKEMNYCERRTESDGSTVLYRGVFLRDIIESGDGEIKETSSVLVSNAKGESLSFPMVAVTESEAVMLAYSADGEEIPFALLYDDGSISDVVKVIVED